jgi:Beta-galactosidase/Beta-galactosidase trimerisation domain
LKLSKEYIGCQIWIEPDDSAERIERLFAAAAETGLGWARLFLIWSWVEPEPGVWKFGLFDRAFDAAASHGIRIKATLTANSGPWHIGTPSMLHSHTGFLSPEQRKPARRYIQACVERYAKHPALGQWILWNEPFGGNERTEETLQHWQGWLQDRYQGSIDRLNKRWRTGYRSFGEVPFPEDVAHEAHRGSNWNSYGPWLADWGSRVAWLSAELAWVRDVVREVDPTTETCVNPIPVLSNHPAAGIDLDAIGRVVDVIGASYHPAWHFTFAAPLQFPALMVAGVRLQASHPSVKHVEVTEVQSGSTLNSSNRPREVSPGEIAKFYLAGLAAGAESVTGWCFNVRSHDFEAGDWGLLDDMDRPSPRSRMLRRVSDRLALAFEHTGAWKPAQPRAWVAIDSHAQAVEWIESLVARSRVPGRLAHDGANGAAVLATRLMHCGVSTAMARVIDMPDRASEGDLIVLSHLVAWDASVSDRLLSFVESGGGLLIDATSGRKDPDATLHRPWPGGLAERIGLRAVGLQSRSEGYGLLLNGLSAGRWLLTRLAVELDEDEKWEAWSQPRFEHDGEPCVWERPLGQGRIIVARGVLGPSLVHEDHYMPAVDYILNCASSSATHPIRPVGGHPSTFVVPISVERGRLTAVLAPEPVDRGGRPVRLRAPSGTYLDLWTGDDVDVAADREMTLSAVDGVSLLWLPPA